MWRDPPYTDNGMQDGKKTLASFPSKTAYAEYIKSILQVGMKVVAVSGERKGDRGKYLGTNGGLPPCHVEWEDFGRSWWVQWHDVEIAGENMVQHVMKKVSGSVKCLACGFYGPSSQTGSHFCDNCNVCETCCKTALRCTGEQHQVATERRSACEVRSGRVFMFHSLHVNQNNSKEKPMDENSSQEQLDLGQWTGWTGETWVVQNIRLKAIYTTTTADCAKCLSSL